MVCNKKRKTVFIKGKWNHPQISRTRLRILAVLSNAVVCIVSTRPPTSKSMLAVEIMDTDYLNSLSKFEVLNREVNSPYFTAYPDVGNISGWNYDVCTELKLSKPHITQIHLKDTYRVTPEYKGQFRDLVIGDGEVNFDAIFRTLKETDCVVPLVIEMWAHDEHWRAHIQTAQQRLNQACDHAELPRLFAA